MDLIDWIQLCVFFLDILACCFIIRMLESQNCYAPELEQVRDEGRQMTVRKCKINQSGRSQTNNRMGDL